MALVVAGGGALAAPAQAAAGTTLSQTVTATAHATKTFSWTIDKSAAPTTLDLFRGDSRTVDYTVSWTKDAGTLAAWIDGQVCITNGGSAATQNLASTLRVTKPPNTTPIATQQLDVSSAPVLSPGQTACYPYTINVPVPPSYGASYKVTASTTITNHSAHLGTPYGPNTSASTTMPASATPVHDSVIIGDSQGGTLATTDSSGSTSYEHTFACDGDSGKTVNTASITYADDQKPGPSASATVTVNCYALDVTKTADTSFTRTWTWNVAKSADTTSIALKTGESTTVKYTVDVGATSADSAWAATGQITVHNPAPVDATLVGVIDKAGDIGATVSCPGAAPYTVPAGGDLTCDYTMDLPDSSSRTNTATATLQNHADGVASGTTDFSGTAPIDFSGATVHTVDGTASLSDTYPGSGLPAVVNAADMPASYQYSRTVGPFPTPGDCTVDNTVTVTGTDNPADTAKSSVSIPCTVTASHYTSYTQGGWGGGGAPAALLAGHFATVYPSGVVVGDNGAPFTMRFSSADAVNTYLPASGTAGPLVQNYVNPVATSSGVFGGQVLSLQLNVDFSNAGITDPGFGTLTLKNTGTSLDGMTVAQILGAANTALGAGPLPAGYSIADLNALVTQLNQSWDNGVQSDWAVAHLG